jgi:transposase
VTASPTPSAPADLELIAQLKSRLQYAELRIRVLEERLRLTRIEKYGAGGEKLSHTQMQLFELEPVVSEMIEQAESEHAPVHRSTKKSGKHPGRQELPANLPRVERILPCALDQRVCKRCGKETAVIGYEESSQLDVEPAKYFVLVTKREKRACRSCEDLGVVSAPLPPRIIEKGLASDRIVIDTLISKYCNHIPLHRQSVILERDLGLEISRATLDGWVLKVGELLIPMVAAMRRELISGTYIQADETPVDVQTREGRGKNHQAYLWQYSRPGGTVVFDFRLSRGRDGPKRFLGQFEGILQTDGYAAYDHIGGTRMVHAACWAHARRQFFEAVQLNPRDPVATPIVARMDDLFAIDAEARGIALGIAERHVRRQEAARAILDDIRSKIDAAQSIALPSSALRKACKYAFTLWKKLTRFLEYPELELSTNLAENSMRPVALGRKNWIHIGSPQAGPKVAAILSVVESCRRLRVPVRGYFSAILPGLADLPIRCLPDLTPAVWLARHSRTQATGVQPEGGFAATTA